jgi:3-hydroxybutyrate dehydrogenase
MQMLLKDKVAVVTGSTSGIGLAMAKGFAAEGVHVVLNGFGDAAEIEQIRQGLEREFAIKALYSSADMTKPEQIRQMIGQAKEVLGAVDIVVNNAGIQHVQRIDEFDETKWDQIIAVNLSSAFHVTKAAIPHMREKNWGRIINVASVHGLVASKFKSAYIAAKHGIVGLTKATALDVAEMGITVNAICPGYTMTPLVEKQIPNQMKEHGMSREDVIEKVMLKTHAIKDFVKVEELAAMAVFLSTDHARMMTGQCLTIDGGWSAQ